MPSDVLLQASGSDLIVKLRGTTDSITVHNDLLRHSCGVSSSLGRIVFSDGTFVGFRPAECGLGLPLTFTWLGNGANGTLTGSSYGSNVYEITNHNVSVIFANASSVGSSNTLKYALGAGQSDVFLSGGTGAISLGLGISAQDVYLQANNSGDLIVKIRNDATDSIIVHGALIDNSWGVSSGITQLKFSDGTVLDVGQPAAGQGLATVLQLDRDVKRIDHRQRLQCFRAQCRKRVIYGR